MRSSVRRAFVHIAVLVAALHAPARAADDELAPFEDPAADAASLRSALEKGAAKLAKSDFASAWGDVVVCSRSDHDPRQKLGAEVEGFVIAGRDALRGAGWTPPAAPRLVVVRVRVTGAPSGLIESADGRAFLLRDGDGVRRVDPPVVPARPDGPPLARDMVAAAGRARVWAWASGGAQTQATLATVAARSCVRSVVPAGSLPGWLEDGLGAWLETKVGGAPPAAPAATPPAHVCKSWSPPTAATLERLAASKSAAPPAARPFLGRFVGALVDGKSDGGTKLAALAAESGPLDAALQKTFGVTLAATIAAASPAQAAAPAAPAGAAACDDAGTIACPACAGAGRLDVACGDCAGAGAITCPSCLAYAGCSNCDRGWVYYASGGRAKCRFCAGGKTKCLACAGAMKAPCRACRGSGKVSRRCLACTAGRMPCPASAPPAASAPPCAWCADAKTAAACDACKGVGYLGCRSCWGTERRACARCLGTGERRMVYEDGTTASSSKCDFCSGKGFTRCEECKSGKNPCADCAGKGLGEPDPADCPACAGAGTLPPTDYALLRTPSAPLTEDEVQDQGRMLESAIQFLTGCRTGTGAFALREQRRGRTDVAGALAKPSPFSNAMALWTLAIAGRGKEDPELAGAWEVLRKDGERLATAKDDYVGAQATGLTLRALVMGGEDPRGPLARALIDRLVKAQQADGLWAGDLADPKDTTELLDSLFVAESLRTVRIKGAKVPSAVWQKLLRGATAQLEGRILGGKADFLIGTHVASATALVVMAKEGTLGTKATTFDYASIPAVKRGMAWLDRHFDIAVEPQFSKGAKSPSTDDSGYMAWLFSIQRLGMLLNVEELGGQRWYATGVRHLKKVQYADGSFEERARTARNGPLRTTSGAILFLLRATPPITDTGDDD